MGFAQHAPSVSWFHRKCKIKMHACLQSHCRYSNLVLVDNSTRPCAVMTAVPINTYHRLASSPEVVSNVDSVNSLAHALVRTFLVVEASRRKTRGCAFSFAGVYRTLTSIAAFNAFTLHEPFAPPSFHGMNLCVLRSIVKHYFRHAARANQWMAVETSCIIQVVAESAKSRGVIDATFPSASGFVPHLETARHEYPGKKSLRNT